MIIEMTKKEKTFFNAYMEAIDFTECGDIEQPEHGAELDSDFLRESAIDCLAFYSMVQCYLPTDLEEQAGHDFWFTRNGHGVGFWDKPEIYGEYTADLLTKKAQVFGEVYPVFKDHV